ncbi:hypothetical protein PIB30_104256, partial [Stylosanthes scabra]|nr:hypothetical protein [Stylosanthes scabra]
MEDRIATVEGAATKVEGGHLRTCRFHRVLSLTVRPPPLISAVFPWDCGDWSSALLRCGDAGKSMAEASGGFSMLKRVMLCLEKEPLKEGL